MRSRCVRAYDFVATRAYGYEYITLDENPQGTTIIRYDDGTASAGRNGQANPQIALDRTGRRGASATGTIVSQLLMAADARRTFRHRLGHDSDPIEYD